MAEEIKCISCEKPLTNVVGSVKFLCPSCGKAEIMRCKNCREIVSKYVCPNSNPQPVASTSDSLLLKASVGEAREHPGQQTSSSSDRKSAG